MCVRCVLMTRNRGMMISEARARHTVMLNMPAVYVLPLKQHTTKVKTR